MATDLNAGHNPIETRDNTKRAEQNRTTFGDCADALIAAKESEWRNEKHKAQWKMTLDVYAKCLRALPVEDVNTEAVLTCLRPISATKPETASRVRGRIESVLNAARAKELIPSDKANPARWRGHSPSFTEKTKAHARPSCGNAIWRRARLCRRIATARGHGRPRT